MNFTFLPDIRLIFKWFFVVVTTAIVVVMVSSHGNFKLFVGPMMSGKTARLLSEIASLQHAKIPYVVLQPAINTRDGKQVVSRSGSKLDAGANVLIVDKFPSVEVLKAYEIIAIEEFHLFDAKMIHIIRQLLKLGKTIYAAGLDMDYRGQLTANYTKLLRLSPTEVVYLRAACTGCGNLDACYTQVYLKGNVVTKGIPTTIPEDGTYAYKPVCRRCFKS